MSAVKMAAKVEIIFLSRRYFYPSNLFPLWAECYDTQNREKVAKSAVNYLRKTGAIRCKGGVPTSLGESYESFDRKSALVKHQFQSKGKSF